ncbi:MAG: hypothetical protein ACFUZC_21665 [Chthoniobacteraceae bacterium]
MPFLPTHVTNPKAGPLSLPFLRAFVPSRLRVKKGGAEGLKELTASRLGLGASDTPGPGVFAMPTLGQHSPWRTLFARPAHYGFLVSHEGTKARRHEARQQNPPENQAHFLSPCVS